MAKISDLKLAYRIFMRAYPYRTLDWRPGAHLQKPLREARIAVVTTAGFFGPAQSPFDPSKRGGDCSYRAITLDADLNSLGVAHRSDAFDIRGITEDKNLALPLDRLKSLVQSRDMGSIASPGRLIANTGPEVAQALLDDGVDAVLLTPV